VGTNKFYNTEHSRAQTFDRCRNIGLRKHRRY